jgi:hypothetical protein
MIYDVKDVDAYLKAIPEDRVEAIQMLRQVILGHLPEGFEEDIQYGMIGYVVPLSIYPKGYHCKPNTPLPFMSIASQKNTINLYHMGIYAHPGLNDWFVSTYEETFQRKLDMGKGCFRFKKIEHIPFELIAQLCLKMSVQDVIDIYEDK